MGTDAGSKGLSGWRAACALIMLTLAVYVPGLWSVPPVDRDESRFAQASRQMVMTGDYVVPKVQDRPRLNKPPLIYWLQSGSARVFGDDPGQWANGNIWVFRLPSVLCAIGAVLLTWRLGVWMFGRAAGVGGAALLALSPMVIWDAHQARADQLLLLTVVGTIAALWTVWSGSAGATESKTRGSVARAWAWAMAFWVGMGLGILAKGPITPMVAVLTALGLCVVTGRWRWVWTGLKPLWGVPVMLAVVGPWVYEVGSRVGWERYVSIVWEETVGRSGDAAEGHWGPPGYHTVMLSVLLWPGSMLTLMAVVDGLRSAYRAWRGRRAVHSGSDAAHRDPVVFLIAWTVPSWLVFELIATKLPHYTLPMYPALALLSAKVAVDLTRGQSPLLAQARSLGSRLGFAIWVGIGFLGLGTAAVMLVVLGGSTATLGVPTAWSLLAALVAALGVLLWLANRAIGQGRFVRAHALGGVCVIVWVWVVLGVVLPRSQRVWVSPGLERAIATLSAGVESPPPVALVGYQEDSAIYLLRGRGERIGPDDAEAWMRRHAASEGVVAVDALRHPDLARRLAGEWAHAATIEGFNYSVGRTVRVEVYSTRLRAGAHR